jgi:hypothetical protein
MLSPSKQVFFNEYQPLFMKMALDLAIANVPLV